MGLVLIAFPQCHLNLKSLGVPENCMSQYLQLLQLKMKILSNSCSVARMLDLNIISINPLELGKSIMCQVTKTLCFGETLLKKIENDKSSTQTQLTLISISSPSSSSKVVSFPLTLVSIKAGRVLLWSGVNVKLTVASSGVPISSTTLSVTCRIEKDVTLIKA